MSWREVPKELTARVLTAAFATSPAIVNYVAVGSLLILLAKLLWLDHVPELFPHAGELGRLVNDLLSATLASYLFFMISFQVPRVIERRQAGAGILMLGYKAAGQVIYFYTKTLPNQTGSFKDLTLEEVAQRFRTLRPMDRSPIVATPASAERLTWLQAMIACKDDLCATIDKLWRYSKFIDSELAGLLDALETSTFVHSMEFMKAMVTPNAMWAPDQTLAIWASMYFDCFKAAHALAAYCDWYRKTYGFGNTTPRHHDHLESNTMNPQTATRLLHVWTAVGILGAVFVALGAIFSYRYGRITDRYTDERISKSNADAATAIAESKRLDAENKQLGIQLEKERQQRLALEQRVEPRHLSDQQEAALERAIQGAGWRQAQIIWHGDGEPEFYAKELAAIFERAGVTVKVGTLGPFMPSAWGLLVVQTTNDDSKRLKQMLDAIGVPCQLALTNDTLGPKDHPTLVVGTRQDLSASPH